MYKIQVGGINRFILCCVRYLCSVRGALCEKTDSRTGWCPRAGLDAKTKRENPTSAENRPLVVQPFVFFYCCGGVRLCLCGTDAANWPFVHPQMIMSEYWATVEWYWQEKTEGLEEKPVPVPLCPSQIPYGLPWARTRVPAVRGWRLKPRSH
jgi:hypothetical protein